MVAPYLRIPVFVAVVFCGTMATACGTTGHASPTPSQTPVADNAEPRADLTRRVAAAKDRRFSAAYTWNGGGVRRAVTVTIALDGTWRVDLPGTALVGRPDGVYQCLSSGCSRIARAASTVPDGLDPKIQHPFTDWLAVLTDRHAAVSVAVAQPLPGSSGECFSVDPTTVAIAPPIEAGIFCYDDSGLPTAVRASFGTLMLAGVPTPGPATAELAAPARADGPPGTSASPQSG